MTAGAKSQSSIVEGYLDVLETFSKQLLNFVVNLADSSGNTAMHYAISHSNFDVVSVLLDSKVCDVNKQNKVRRPTDCDIADCPSLGWLLGNHVGVLSHF